MWYEVIENSEVISNLYIHVPLLRSVRLTEVTLYQNGSRMLLKLFAPIFPDKIPKSWEMYRYNTLQIMLEFLNVESFDLLNWIGETKADINIEECTKHNISLIVSSPDCTIRAHAYKVRLAVNGYRFK